MVWQNKERLIATYPLGALFKNQRRPIKCAIKFSKDATTDAGSCAPNARLKGHWECVICYHKQLIAYSHDYYMRFKCKHCQ